MSEYKTMSLEKYIEWLQKTTKEKAVMSLALVLMLEYPSNVMPKDVQVKVWIP